MIANQAFVNWFRDSSPYIHAHRNQTFVINFGGEALLDPEFDHLVHDFALLKSLGIRLVLVHGIRPQIDERLIKLGAPSLFHDNLRITSEVALQCVKEAAGTARVEIEALLSLGLANTPMAGYGLRVASGNFVTAKPIGVIGGVDYGHTGEVRRIDAVAIAQQLDLGAIVVMSPIGYSPSGEVFNLSAEQLAMHVAIALKAQKLILLTEDTLCNPGDGKQIPQMTTPEAADFLNNHPDGLPLTASLPLKAAIQCSKSGVSRVHLVDRKTDGALLLELFTRAGAGTLISAMPFEELRPATLSDIGGILELIKPLEQQGILAKREREKIEMEIADYWVIERDGLIVGCTALHRDETSNSGVIACLAVHPEYRGASRGSRLLQHALNTAHHLGICNVFALSTQTMHWFIERGFSPSDLQTLPEGLKKDYHPQRNSKVFYKRIE